MSSVIGTSLDSSVIAQMEKRSSLLKKKSLSDRELLYLHGRTSWVKMSSGVDVVGNTSLAASNILMGGTLLKDSVQRKGILSEDASYDKDANLGFRPMAGISSVEVASQNTFGTLREAKISFRCWTLEQLDIMEKLYMRPGFHVLLEWGESLYFKNKEESLTTSIKTISNFFNPSVSYEKLQKDIESLKKDSSHNYDAMLGVVKNFSWSYNIDGGYDCSTILISRGDLIQSVRLAMFPPITESSYNKSIITNILEEIKVQASNGVRKLSDIDFSKIGISSLTRFDDFNNPILTTKRSITHQTADESSTEDKISYITLSGLSSILNNTYSLVNGAEHYVKFSEANSYEFYSFPDHFSVNPKVCIIRNSTEASTLFNLSNPYSFVEGMDTTPSMISNNILGMFVSVEYLLQLSNSFIDSDQSSSLFDFLKKVLDDINRSLGSVNELDIHYEEEDSTYYIVDRKNTPNKVSTIQLSGLGSFTTNISLTSRITSNLSSMIAIAAQATSAGVNSNFSDEYARYLKWSEGLNDRVFKKRESNSPAYVTSPIQKDVRDGIIRSKDQLLSRIRNFSSEGKVPQETAIIEKAFKSLVERDTYISEYFGAASIAYEKYLKDYIAASSIDDSTPPPGILPFELSFSLDGISGLKIGQGFKINKGILPPHMDQFVGFIITKLDHNISNNKWKTNVGALTFIISDTFF